MSEFTVNAILDMQRQLLERYKAVWAHMEPQEGRNQILWMICELGEVIDVVKKQGAKQIMEEPEVRRHFVEEMTDVLMYYGDVLLQKTYVSDYFTGKQSPNNGELDQYLIEGHHEGIVN